MTISLGILGSIVAGLAQFIAHQIARRYHWRRIPRYVCGITIIALAYAPVVFSALTLEQAAVLYGLFWLITGASGLAAWIAYEMDAQGHGSANLTQHDLEVWANAIAGEHDDAA